MQKGSTSPNHLVCVIAHIGIWFWTQVWLLLAQHSNHYTITGSNTITLHHCSWSIDSRCRTLSLKACHFGRASLVITMIIAWHDLLNFSFSNENTHWLSCLILCGVNLFLLLELSWWHASLGNVCALFPMRGLCCFANLGTPRCIFSCLIACAKDVLINCITNEIRSCSIVLPSCQVIYSSVTLRLSPYKDMQSQDCFLKTNPQPDTSLTSGNTGTELK